MATEAAAISVQGLTKRYGRLAAVDDIYFEVPEGEIFGFLGPNGAGKTTTVKMLTGVSAPTGGKASVFGHDIVKDSFAAKELMGIVPDVSNAYVEYTAWSNLKFTGAMYGMPRKLVTARAAELLKRFDLYDKRKSKVKSYSMGMRRKLIIAMALINQAKILFMDEPTTGLDVQTVLDIREMIKELNRDGTTVFLTTHNLTEANALCDRIAIINHGKLIAVDTPENLKRAAENVQSVEVAFHRQPEGAEERLRSLASVAEVQKAGDKFRLLTGEPDAVVKAVVSFAEQEGLNISFIDTPGPSLEDVFVQLTGISDGTQTGGGK
jgi:ABC-2 type transport system ATP-binding protein